MTLESQKSSGDSDSRLIPGHIAVIMDGNGRWARKRAMPRYAGHRAGVKSVRGIVERAAKNGISFLTLFAFSSENWSRPREEVSKLMGLFIEALQREVDDLHKNNVRLRFIGCKTQLAPDLVESMSAAEEKTRSNSGLTLLVAVAYGGRWDIMNAVRKVGESIENGAIGSSEISEEALVQHLALHGIPDPDLLIRTGGEQRISNFLLWNLAYTELYFCDCLWPDFGEQDFNAALDHFAMRQRRFGRTGDQAEPR
jgi:undecaprenyl diphosphate synthase